MGLTVGFDATAAVHQRAGIGRYTRQLLQEYGRMGGQDRFRLFYANRGQHRGDLPALDDRFARRPVPVSDRLLNALWHRARIPLPVQVFTGQFDVFHSPDFSLPPIYRAPAIVTIHDLAFFRTPDCAVPSLAQYLQRVVPRSILNATHVIAVSENTRRDILELVDIPETKVTMILEGVDAPVIRPSASTSAAVLRGLGISEPYILAVGTLEPRKNYSRLIQAYALLRHQGMDDHLVIAGTPGWLYEDVFRCVDRFHLNDSVHFVSPDDDELACLYHRATAFVYASLYEGFGLPPLEALAWGLPVACSSAASLPEVVGDAAVQFDPYDVEGIARCLETVVTDVTVRATLQQRGPLRASTLSWRRAAAETVALYHRVAAND